MFLFLFTSFVVLINKLACFVYIYYMCSYIYINSTQLSKNKDINQAQVAMQMASTRLSTAQPATDSLSFCFSFSFPSTCRFLLLSTLVLMLLDGFRTLSALLLCVLCKPRPHPHSMPWPVLPLQSRCHLHFTLRAFAAYFYSHLVEKVD